MFSLLLKDLISDFIFVSHSHTWHIIGSNPQQWDVFIYFFLFIYLFIYFFFLLFEFYVTWVDGRWQISCQNVDFHNWRDHKDIFSEKTLYSGVGMSEFVWLSQGLCTCQLQLRPIGFEKAKIYRGFLPIKEVIKTDNSNRTSTPSTFFAEKINVLRCYRYPGLCIIFFFLSFSISSNEWALTIYISSNEWDLKGGTTVHLISMRTRCFHYCRKSRSPSHNFFVLKHVTLQILDFISVS